MAVCAAVDVCRLGVAVREAGGGGRVRRDPFRRAQDVSLSTLRRRRLSRSVYRLRGRKDQRTKWRIENGECRIRHCVFVWRHINSSFSIFHFTFFTGSHFHSPFFILHFPFPPPALATCIRREKHPPRAGVEQDRPLRQEKRKMSQHAKACHDIREKENPRKSGA